MKIVINKKMSLLDALSLLSPDSSKSKLREWLKHERVKVDGQVIKIANTPLIPGQEVVVGKKEVAISGGIQILYEDSHLVVIDKPAELLSVAKDTGVELSAHEVLKRHYERRRRVFPVHRLDKGTSGVMLFALSEEARTEFKPLFEKHEIERTYQAVVEGRVQESEGTWRSYLFEDGNLVMRVTNDPEKGKHAITNYTVLGRSKKHTLLEVQLETGRKNQIRVHSSHAGYPVAGDSKYGAKGNPAKRLCLHARRLEFRHPFTDKVMHFESPVPEVFGKIVKSGESDNEHA